MTMIPEEAHLDTKLSLNRSKFHGHPRFYKLLQEMADLHSRKNHDYSGDDPLSNLKSTEEIGIPAWKGVLVRLMDKWGRLKTFAREEHFEVKDESVIDTLMDNAVYSLLCIILFESKDDAVKEQTALAAEMQATCEGGMSSPVNKSESGEFSHGELISGGDIF